LALAANNLCFASGIIGCQCNCPRNRWLPIALTLLCCGTRVTFITGVGFELQLPENEDLVFTLESVVDKFGVAIAPHALAVCQHLTNAFWRMQVCFGTCLFLSLLVLLLGLAITMHDNNNDNPNMRRLHIICACFFSTCLSFVAGNNDARQ
jgi:hypothetical protein